MSGFPEGVRSVAWSPDGKLLATAVGGIGAASARAGTVWLWHPDGKAAAPRQDHTDGVTALAWSPDGTLASGSLDGTVVLSKGSGTPVVLRPEAGGVLSVAWSPDGGLLAIGAIRSPTDNTTEIWSAAGTRLSTLHTLYSGGKFYNLGWSPDGQLLVGGATDYGLWTADGTSVFATNACAQCPPAWGMAWAPDGNSWAIGNESGSVRLFDRRGATMAALAAYTGVNAISWLPDSSALIAGPQLFAPDGRSAGQLDSIVRPVEAYAWSAEGRLLAVATSDETVGIYDPTGAFLLGLAPPAGGKPGLLAQRRIAWSPDGRVLAVGYSNATAKLWQIADALGG